MQPTVPEPIVAVPPKLTLPKRPNFGAFPQHAAIPERVLRDKRGVQAGTVHPDCASYVGAAAEPNSLVVLFHGFSVGNGQFWNLVDKLLESEDVYAPRLPGHGRLIPGRHFVSDPQCMPGVHDTNRYTDFVGQVMQEARSLAQSRGLPIKVAGFSLGGAMAIDAAMRFDQNVAGLSVVAPMLRPRERYARALFTYTRARIYVSPSYAQRLEETPFRWTADPLKPASRATTMGYQEFPLAKLFACINYAREVHQRATSLRIPTQLIMSEADSRCCIDTARKVLSTAPEYDEVMLPFTLGMQHADLAEFFAAGPVTTATAGFLTSRRAPAAPMRPRRSMPMRPTAPPIPPLVNS